MNDHDEYRIEHALEVWEPLEDLTPNEIKRLAKAISNADHKNWSSMELAERIAGTVRAIAAARTPGEPGLRTAVEDFLTDHDEGRLDNPDAPWCDSGKCVGVRNLRAALSQPAEAAELRAALLQAMDEAQPDADNRGLADRVVELMSDSDEAMQR